jgi:hypothetical protein
MSYEDPTELGGNIVETSDGNLIFIPEDERNYTVTPFAYPGEDGVEFREDVSDTMRKAFHRLQERSQATTSYRVIRSMSRKVLEELGVQPITDTTVAELMLSVLINKPEKGIKLGE